MKIGGHVSIAGGLSNAIENELEIGGNCLQIFRGSPRTWKRQNHSEAEIEKFRNLVVEYDLSPVFVHAMYLINLMSDRESVAKQSYEVLSKEMEFADAINAAGVVVHIGAIGSRDYDEVHSELVLQLKKLLQECEWKTKLLLENSAGQKGKLLSLEQIAQVMNAVESPQLGVCLDTAHLCGAGYDLSKVSIVNELSKWLIENDLIDRVGCLHINDSAVPCGSGRDIHANIGEGTIGLDGLKNIVTHKTFCDYPMILEVPGDDPKHKGPDSVNIQRVRQMFEK